MRRPVLFLDDGGVLNDNTVRAPQWQALVGEFLAPRLGGDPTAWARANRVVVEAIFAPGAWEALLNGATDYSDYERRYYSTWLGGMCAELGLERPPEQECLALGAAAEVAVVPRIRSAFPGAAEAVRALRTAGYELHTASGGGSVLLGMYLDGMGIRDCFGRLFGPDLINAFKIGPDYYNRILADLNLRPGETLFLDDSPEALGWAAQLGAGALLVGHDERATGFRQINCLAELPRLLEGY
jgi:HAD superfamily hydrolase (TIGR01509 family)